MAREMGDSALLGCGLLKNGPDFRARHWYPGILKHSLNLQDAIFNSVVLVDQRVANVNENPLDVRKDVLQSTPSSLLVILIGNQATTRRLRALGAGAQQQTGTHVVWGGSTQTS